jgi:hypothetical protein
VRRPIVLRLALLGSILLALLGPGAVRAVQKGDALVLVVEEVLGEVSVWLQDGVTGTWKVLLLPAEMSQADLKGVSLAPDISPPTLVSPSGQPLMVYNENEFLAVAGGLVRLQDATWQRWLESGTGWEPYGPPAGSPDPESQRLQDLLNRHLAAYQLHDSIVMRPELDTPPAVVTAGNRHFWYAHAVMPGTTELLRVMLLVELDANDDFARIILLGANPDAVTQDRARWLNASEAYAAVIYDLATGTVQEEPLFMARDGWRYLFLLEPTGQSYRLASSVHNWPLAVFRRIASQRILAHVEDLSLVTSLEPAKIIRQTQPGTFRTYDYRAISSPTRDPAPDDCPTDVASWIEQRTSTFSLVYSNPNAYVGDRFFQRFGETLEEDYARYEQLFGTALTLPLNIRIYPTRQLYHCLNPVAPEIPATRFHSRIGSREIVLLGEGLGTGREGWEAELLAAVRYELVSLFTEEVTGSRAPAGLAGGLALYAQEPEVVLAGTRSDAIRPPWEFLWEEPAALTNKAVAARAMTIVAYLVEAYGWDTFREFLEELATAVGYRAALAGSFGVPPSALQAEWEQYDPLYAAGRWRANIFHGFDFAEFEQLIAAGAYADAVTGLKEALTFLESLGDGDNAARAGQLLQQAQKGEQAGALVVQSRQAIQSRRYRQALDLADTATALYEELGDERRMDELQAYRAWAAEVLTLEQELARFQSNGSSAGDPQLLTVALRLAELGEDDGLVWVEAQRQEQEKQEEEQLLDQIVKVLALLAALIILRLLLGFVRRAPESRLL